MIIRKYLIHGEEFPMGEDDLIDYLSQYGFVKKDGQRIILSKEPWEDGCSPYHTEQFTHVRVYHEPDDPSFDDILKHAFVETPREGTEKEKRHRTKYGSGMLCLDLGEAIEEFLKITENNLDSEA